MCLNVERRGRVVFAIFGVPAHWTANGETSKTVVCGNMSIKKMDYVCALRIELQLYNALILYVFIFPDMPCMKRVYRDK